METSSDVWLIFGIFILTGFITGLVAPYYEMNLIPLFFTIVLAFIFTVVSYLMLENSRKAVLAPLSSFISALASTSLVYIINGYDQLTILAMPFAYVFSYLLHMHFYYMHVKEKKSLYRTYLKFRNTYIIAEVIVFLLGIAMVSSPLLKGFGLVIATSAPMAFLTMLFLLAPMIRLETYLREKEKLTKEELLARRYIKKYGKKAELIPFYAAWLGTAVDKVYELIDSLEAKGYLGHNFFAIQNLFFWVVSFIFLFAGSSLAGYIYAPAIICGILLITGISLLGPQYLLERRFRRILALILLLLGYYLMTYFQLSSLAVKMWVFSLIAALVSIYFAYVDKEMLSAFFAAVYLFALYLFAWYASTLRAPNLVLPLASAATVFIIIASEAASLEKEF